MTKSASNHPDLAHGALSDPGRYGPEIGRIPGTIADLCRAVQGLLMHDGALAMYGLEASDFAQFSRQTLAVEARLDQFSGPGGGLDLGPRAPARRMIGTCRDYALLLTGFLRHHGVAARVRCGFAAYLSIGRFDDHWICQAWRPDEERWQAVDAQLDERHLEAHAIGFDHLDLPDGQFLSADVAWNTVRTGAEHAHLFNAGAAARGEWLIAVNLARDYLALNKQETSEWDRWREAPEAARDLSAAVLAWADEMAEEIAAKAADPARPRSPRLPGAPFW